MNIFRQRKSSTNAKNISQRWFDENSKFHVKSASNVYTLFFRKYPAEQMQLIRKRLKVEFWLDEQLRHLYNVRVKFQRVVF